VFGRVVGGLEVLSKLEQIPVDDKDKPTHPIKIVNVEVFQNPLDDIDKEISEERRLKLESIAAETGSDKASKRKKADLFDESAASTSKQIGKYLTKKKRVTAEDSSQSVSEETEEKKTKASGSVFKDFSGW